MMGLIMHGVMVLYGWYDAPPLNSWVEYLTPYELRSTLLLLERRVQMSADLSVTSQKRKAILCNTNIIPDNGSQEVVPVPYY